jgi:hypothetical protein
VDCVLSADPEAPSRACNYFKAGRRYRRQFGERLVLGWYYRGVPHR